MSSNLIAEAIADAKAVRATALQNAKSALEEAFSTKVREALSEKLKEEIADENIEGAVDATTVNADQDGGQKFNGHAEEAVDVTADAGKDAGLEVDGHAEEESVTSEEIEELLKELEEDAQEAAPAPVAPEVAPTPAPVAPAPVAPAPVAPEAVPAPVAPEAVPAPVAEESDEEEVDLNELLQSINEDSEEEAEEEEEESVKPEEDESEVVAENKEFRKTIEFLREQLNEVNLLNAKLLYTNKLFKANGLNNAQKMKVIEAFDLTKSIREVKITYAAMTEALNLNKPAVSKTAVITEGLSSKSIGSTKPSVANVIVADANDMATRFQKLAGITK